MTNIVVRTYNIPAGRLGPLDARRAVLKVLNGADVVVLQEVEEIRHLLRKIPGWDAAFYTRAKLPELVIMWRKDLFERKGRYLLNSSDTRWGLQLGMALRHKPSGKVFRVYDAHTPIKTYLPNRLIIFKKIVNTLIRHSKGYTGPVLIGGDWNANPKNRKIKPFLDAGFKIASPGPTHGFGGGHPNAIDYFVYKNATVVRQRVMPYWYGDHRAVEVVFKI